MEFLFSFEIKNKFSDLMGIKKMSAKREYHDENVFLKADRTLRGSSTLLGQKM